MKNPKIVLIAAISFWSIFVFAETTSIKVLSIPDGAEVFINNILKGITPLEVEIETPATIKILVVKSGFSSFEKKISIKTGDTIIVDLENSQQMTDSEYTKFLAKSEQNNPSPGDEGSSQGNVNQVGEPASETVTPSEGTQIDAKILRITKYGSIPDNLLNNVVEGVAIFQLQINHRGEVIESKPTIPLTVPHLDEFISNWIKTWEIQAATMNSFPITSKLPVKISYKLPDGIFEIMDVPDTIQPKNEIAIYTTSPLPSVTPKTNVNDTEARPTPVSEKAVGKINFNDESWAEKKLDQKPHILQPPKFGSIPIDIQKLNLKGEAKFKLYIGFDGSVKKVEITKSTGDEKLDAWITPFLQSMQWEPAMISDKAVNCKIELTLSFNTIACSFDFKDLFKD
jgi:hypothetical protein